MGRPNLYENVVRTILLTREATRADDKLLYYWLLREEGFNTEIPLSQFLIGSNFPNWESVTRCRRKLQEKFPELRPSEGDQIRRKELEDEYVEYARGNE